jgi:hypothetical protein
LFAGSGDDGVNDMTALTELYLTLGHSSQTHAAYNCPVAIVSGVVQPKRSRTVSEKKSEPPGHFVIMTTMTRFKVHKLSLPFL